MQKYFFEGTERWQWPFGSPNELAAFIATLLPFLWFAANLHSRSERRLVRSLWLLLELFGTFVLIKTLSRGGTVAWLAALLWHAGLLRTSRLAWLLPRLAVLAIGSAFTPFAARIAPAHLSQDPAVLHRLTQWTGSMEMAFLRPLGWGAGRSGHDYMNWFQWNSAETIFGTVNSYLYLAVEFGIIAFFGAIVVAVLPIAVGWGTRNDDSTGGQVALVHAAAASWLAWAVANFSSTLVTEPLLWIVPLATAAVVGNRMRTHRPWRAALTSLGAATTALGVVLSLGWLGLRREPVTLGVKGDTLIIRSTAGAALGGGSIFYPDAAVVGDYPGRLVREAAKEASATLSWATPIDGHSPVALAGFDRAVLTGRHASDADKFHGLKRALILHPLGTPPEIENGIEIELVLPQVDERANARLWTAWASARGGKVSPRPLKLRGVFVDRDDVIGVFAEPSL